MDVLAIVAFSLTFVSLFFVLDFGLEISLSSVALIVFAIFGYSYDNTNRRIKFFHSEIVRLNENINIFERLSKVEVKIERIENEQKSANRDFVY